MLRLPNAVSHSALANFLNFWCAWKSFAPAVPAQIVVITIAVVFAVGSIVLDVIADEIVQGEAIVRRQKVDPCGRCAPITAEDFA